MIGPSARNVVMFGDCMLLSSLLVVILTFLLLAVILSSFSSWPDWDYSCMLFIFVHDTLQEQTAQKENGRVAITMRCVSVLNVGAVPITNWTRRRCAFQWKTRTRIRQVAVNILFHLFDSWCSHSKFLISPSCTILKFLSCFSTSYLSSFQQ